MKSLAIFGDSFAENENNEDEAVYSDCYWPNIVAEKLNVIKYKNFALGSTSIDWSYLKFLENHKNYEKCIFIMSSATRGSIIDSYSGKHFLKMSFMSHRTLENNLTINEKVGTSINNAIDLKILKNELYKWENYHKPHGLLHRAIRDSIKYNRPDTIIIDGFEDRNNPNYDKLQKSSPCMRNIQIVDLKNLGFINVDNWSDENEEANIREASNKHHKFCHMSKSQNEKFAEYIIKHIHEDNFDIHDTLHIGKIDQFYPMTQDETFKN